jgi:hypothetical protein
MCFIYSGNVGGKKLFGKPFFSSNTLYVSRLMGRFCLLEFFSVCLLYSRKAANEMYKGVRVGFDMPAYGMGCGCPVWNRFLCYAPNHASEKKNNMRRREARTGSFCMHSLSPAIQQQMRATTERY